MRKKSQCDTRFLQICLTERIKKESSIKPQPKIFDQIRKKPKENVFDGVEYNIWFYFDCKSLSDDAW